MYNKESEISRTQRVMYMHRATTKRQLMTHPSIVTVESHSPSQYTCREVTHPCILLIYHALSTTTQHADRVILIGNINDEYYYSSRTTACMQSLTMTNCNSGLLKLPMTKLNIKSYYYD